MRTYITDDMDYDEFKCKPCDLKNRKLSVKTAPYLPPCRVCNSQASGFHYGVNTCEACKGFFRRSLARKIPYQKCSKNDSCSMKFDSRNACPACRLRKCLSVGMSKAAIKTGRYTHEKRTMDTMEIKGALTRDGVIDDRSSSSQFADVESKIPPQSPLTINDGFEEVYMEVVAAFRHSFADTAYVYENLDKLEMHITDLLKLDDLPELTYVIATRGDGYDAESKQVEKITEQSEILRSLMKLNSSLTGDVLNEHPDFINASKQLYECWLVNVDRFIHHAVSFAKTLPGFQLLPISDQVKLIKHGRAEIASLVKYKHFNSKFDAFIDYHTETQSLYVFPNKLLQYLFFGANHHSQHQWVYERTISHMSKLELRLENVAVLCAISIFSPDREGLSDSSKQIVSALQQKFILLLQFSLSQTHNDDRLALARFLLLLPLLRELNELNDKALILAQQRLQPTMSPLLQEMLPQPTSVQRVM